MSSSACSCSSLVCAPWQKTRPNRKRHPFTPYCFPFFKNVLFCSCLFVPWQGSRHSSSRHSPLQDAWEFGRIAASAASPLVASSVRSVWLSGSRVAAPPGTPFAGDHATGSPLTQCPPARLWLNARRPASDSMPAGSPLTQARRIAADSSPPDRRWLKPAGSPLTQARRIGADSCPLAAANPSPVDQVHMSRPGVPCVSVLLCPQEHFKLTLSCLVHGDSSGAGGSSCCGHGGHSSRLPPCRGNGGGRWGTLCGPLTPGHAQKKPQPPSQPRRASGSCGLSCPVLSVWPWRAFLSFCTVLSV